MVFPDQSHINRVRNALWQRSAGGASLMVGAGFSRYATTNYSNAQDMPAWQDLTNAISDELYSQGERERRRATITDTPASNSPSRLAQEYETAFGRACLHRFIIHMIRDDEFHPREMHVRFMKLPWRDVFTTNWDPLLERTRPFVIDRKYSVVHNANDIPLSDRPRVVKLHGSLPAHFPLVFTEEDYRTYPYTFAPLVNTVQQAMMETIFLLIGFSGDDPNFLHWAGWVRDNLGRSAPKIYLAGWLNLSIHRRRMLETNNIVPIDLSRHPNSQNWPDHLKHYYATKWILHTLENGRPYNFASWPTPRKPQDSLDLEIIEPVERQIFGEPKFELIAPIGDSNSVSLSDVQETLLTWSINRKAYPNWLILPMENRPLFSECTKNWESSILKFLPNFSLFDQLNAIRELIWRLAILLEPISHEIEKHAQDILGNIDCQNRMILSTSNTEHSWTEIRDAWLYIALQLVTVARQRFDRGSFNNRISELSPFSNDTEVIHYINHERSLWEMFHLNFKTGKEVLDSWSVIDCDPIWMLRKSAILSEIGHYEEANRLITSALMAIRKYPNDDHNFAGPSREACALHLSLTVEDFTEDTEVMRRLKKLTLLKCNTFEAKNIFCRTLQSRHVSSAKVSSKRHRFDFDGTIRSTISFSNSGYHQWVVGRRAVRFTEITGLPPLNQSSDPASEVLKLAAKNLILYESEMSVRLILRAANRYDDECLDSIFSRTRVAALPFELAKSISGNCLEAIDFALPRISGVNHDDPNLIWTNRIGVFLEILSRVSIRLDPEVAETIFNKALKWYGSSVFASNKLLQEPIANFLTRSWKALPRQFQKKYIFDLLCSPVHGFDGFLASTDQYPDPGDLLELDIDISDITLDEGLRRRCVDFLLRGLRSDGEARKRASRRICWLNSYNLFDESEKLSIAFALWGDDYTSHDDLPTGTSVNEWGFFALPESVKGIASKRFRRKWLNTNASGGKNLYNSDEILWHVGSAISYLRGINTPMKFSKFERDYLLGVIDQWADAPVTYPLSISDADPKMLMFRQQRLTTTRTISGLMSVLVAIRLTEPVVEKVYKKFKDFEMSNTPALTLTAGLIKSVPRKFDDVALSMKMALVSDKDFLARDAVNGLNIWLEAASESTILAPPVDLIREIGIIIANRRMSILGQALVIAKNVFSFGSSKQQNAIKEMALQGLGYLLQELRYDRNYSNEDKEYDIPFLRWGCTHLALAMAAKGLQDSKAVSSWLKNVDADPLPEVRHARYSFGGHIDNDN